MLPKKVCISAPTDRPWVEAQLRSVDPSRLILTPHSLGNSPAARDAGHRMAVDSLLTLLAGEPPSSVPNPEAITRWE